MTLASAPPAPGIAAALARAPRGRRISAVAVTAPDADPAAIVHAALSRGLEVAVWLRPSDDLAIVGIGRAWAVEPGGPGRFAEAEAAWSALSPDLDRAGGRGAGETSPVLLGGLGFGSRRASDRGPWAPFPEASLVLPELAWVRQGGVARLVIAAPAGSEAAAGPRLEALWAGLAAARPPGAPGSPTGLAGPAWSHPSRAAWERAVALVAGAVGRGRLDKVVLARRVDLELGAPASPAGVLGALSAGAPESAAYLFARGGRAFVGASPERLVRVDGRRLQTVAVAGSAPRGRDPAEDARLAAALLASDKDREEHAVVVSMLREVLTPIASGLDIAPQPSVLALRHIQHLVTPVEGTLRERVAIVALAGLLHPTPAVGGAPRDAALAMLAEHEDFDRGWYAGPVGWVGPDGGGELMVALRSGVLHGARASLFAGCGIVADSDGAREWAESRMKLRPMVAALGLDPDDVAVIP